MPKINIVTRLQHWMDSVPGQTFLNYAYSWGASIVILGALFKLTHLPGGNVMLFLGMGTEAVVFFLAAFDRPFDKNEIGKTLPEELETDEEIERAEAIADGTYVATDIQESVDAEQQELERAAASVGAGPAVIGGTPSIVGGSTIIGGEPSVVSGGASVVSVAPVIIGGGVSTPSSSAASIPTLEEKAELASQHPIVQAAVADATTEEEAQKLASIIRMANDELLHRAQAVLSPEMEAATQVYIDKLRALTETFAMVDEQTARLTKDSQEMENLNRTLIGINKIYDLHFASISKQVNTIEEINDQTRGLAAKIQEVNDVYAQMIQKLTAISNPLANS
ncbi:MAG: gliding motility protein GldL [Bacteroidaceae bacterium]|nr:gliding motility protein GldL [Bacteroidaceae bacterium]